MKACFIGSTGVLVETARLERLAYNAAFEDLGIDSYWNVATYERLLQVPGGVEQVIAELEPHWPVGLALELQEKQRAQLRATVAGGLQPRPGVAEALGLCKRMGIKLAMVSTESRELIDLLLENSQGISRDDFALITSSVDVEEAKPSPAVYAHALRAMNLGAADVIAVEDTPLAQTAALQANLQCYLFPGEYAVMDGDLLVTRDLPGTLERAHTLWSTTGSDQSDPDPLPLQEDAA